MSKLLSNHIMILSSPKNSTFAFLSSAMYGKDDLQNLWSSWMDAYFRFQENPEDGICIKSLPKIVAPTLIIHGAKDAMVPGFHPEFIHKNVQNSKLHIFEEGKHNLHLRFHKEFNAYVKEFLST